MAKNQGALLLGVAALAAFGMRKKKKKKGPAVDTGIPGEPGGAGIPDPGGSIGDPTQKPGAGSVPGAGGQDTKPSGTTPPLLKPDALWVSSDCQVVEFGDETGELWWQNKGLTAAQKFLEANYLDPYEIARDMLLPIAPCVANFPLVFEVESAHELEFKREMFLREYNDVYYLIMSLYKQIAPLAGMDAFNLRFDENCKVEYLGFDWVNVIGSEQMLFYLDYAYPIASDPGKQKPAWLGADITESVASFMDNCVIAVINRWSSDCAVAIMEEFKAGRAEADSAWNMDGPRGQFFKSRPVLQKLYRDLFDLGHSLEDSRAGVLPFDPDEFKGF